MSSVLQFRMSASEQNIERIRRVEQIFGSSGVPLLRTGRLLVAEGTLTKVCRKRSKKRHVFLFNDLLVYGSFLVDGLESLVQQRVLELSGVQARQLADTGGTAFQVMSPSKSFTLCASSPEEAAKWVEFIRSCAGSDRADAVLDPSPVWVPDSDSASCMLCRVEFGLLCRRHHCRKCGTLVCAGCSQRRWQLPAQSAAPLRVCDQCFKSLQPAADS